MMDRICLGILLIAGCDSGQAHRTDAPAEAPAAVVTLSACPPTVDATITDSAVAFVPTATTVRHRAIVEFMITAEHFVLPNTHVMTDPALMVDRGETKCFQFNTQGTYGFLCGVHGFTGTITVQ
jgi:plastocyanin